MVVSICEAVSASDKPLFKVLLYKFATTIYSNSQMGYKCAEIFQK